MDPILHRMGYYSADNNGRLVFWCVCVCVCGRRRSTKSDTIDPMQNKRLKEIGGLNCKCEKRERENEKEKVERRFVAPYKYAADGRHRMDFAIN